MHTVAGNGSSPAATRPQRWPRAHLASTDEKPGLAPSRALLAFGVPVVARICGEAQRLTRICQDLDGRLRRGAEGGAEGPGAASGTGHTQHKATDLPARLTLPHNQGRKVDGPSIAIYPQSVSAGPEELTATKKRGDESCGRVRTRASRASLPSCTQPSRPVPGSAPLRPSVARAARRWRQAFRDDLLFDRSPRTLGRPRRYRDRRAREL